MRRKVLLIALLLVAALSWVSTIDIEAQGVRERYGIYRLTASYTTAQTQTTLLESITNYKYVIHNLIVSVSAATDFYLSDATGGTTRLPTIYLGNNGACVLEDWEIEFARGDGIDYTSGDAVNQSIYMEYSIRRQDT